MIRLMAATVAASVFAVSAMAEEPIRRIDDRFATAEVKETPNFQRHVVPLMGRLGCNGRACHGSFQGAGGFRLSLFGYDFKMDHENLTKGDNPRVDLEVPVESLMLEKPTLTIPHKGGKRLAVDSWQHRVFVRWIEGGAKGLNEAEDPKFVRLDVSPSEIQFARKGETAQLKALAVWSDGTIEDVSPLCRFQTNDEQIAKVSENGLITAHEAGDTHIVAFYDNAVVPVPLMRPVSDLVAEKYPNVPTPTEIDRLVVAKLKKLGVVQADLCTDAEFLRRVSIDIAGTLPTPDEIEKFLADTSADKRAKKIDELLERPAYAAWLATRLCDWTGNNPQKLNNVGTVRGRAPQDWYDWIHKRVKENVPYDTLVEGIVLAASRRPDQSFEDYCKEMTELYAKGSDKSFADQHSLPFFWARNNFRTPNERALGFAYTFLGIRIQCAECHKHPFDQWTQNDFKEFTGFFGRVAYGTNPRDRQAYNDMMKSLELEGKNNGERQRIIARMVDEGKVVPFQELFVTPPQRNGNNRRPNNNPKQQRANAPVLARLLGEGEEVAVNEVDDPRTLLMAWLRSEDNPYFARAFVNRVWSGFFNVGIVNPTDDMSLANPPSNRPLLDHLAAEFVKHNYDMKWLHREIANSRTYQLSWRPNETNKLDERNFSHAVPRRIPAEVAYDAVRQATGTRDDVEKMQGDMAVRAISMATIGGGKGRVNQNNYALQIFGKSIRESNCDCDRSTEASLLQTVYLHNDDEVINLVNRAGNAWPRELAALKRAAEQAAQEADKPRDKEKKVDADDEVARFEARIAEAREKDPKLAEKMEQKLASLKERLKRGDRPNRKGQTDEKPAPAVSNVAVDPEQVIRLAYLRTLSRHPEPGELDRAKAYFAEASSSSEGINGLLWALLNTKEFIVNH